MIKSFTRTDRKLIRIIVIWNCRMRQKTTKCTECSRRFTCIKIWRRKEICCMRSIKLIRTRGRNSTTKLTIWKMSTKTWERETKSTSTDWWTQRDKQRLITQRRISRWEIIRLLSNNFLRRLSSRNRRSLLCSMRLLRSKIRIKCCILIWMKWID